MKTLILISISGLFLSGCATIVKSGRSSVTFNSDVPAKIQTPEQSFELNGSSTILVSNSKSDIPVSITCNNETHKALIPTSFDWGWGGAGNLVFGGLIGWVVDGVGDKAYDAGPVFNAGAYCAGRNTASKP